jgi:hypothetical protein
VSKIDAEDESGASLLVCDPDISWYIRYFGGFGVPRRSVNSRNHLSNNDSVLMLTYLRSSRNLKWPDIQGLTEEQMLLDLVRMDQSSIFPLSATIYPLSI